MTPKIAISAPRSETPGSIAIRTTITDALSEYSSQRAGPMPRARFRSYQPRIGGIATSRWSRAASSRNAATAGPSGISNSSSGAPGSVTPGGPVEERARHRQREVVRQREDRDRLRRRGARRGRGSRCADGRAGLGSSRHRRPGYRRRGARSRWPRRGAPRRRTMADDERTRVDARDRGRRRAPASGVDPSPARSARARIRARLRRADAGRGRRARPHRRPPRQRCSSSTTGSGALTTATGRARGRRGACVAPRPRPGRERRCARARAVCACVRATLGAATDLHAPIGPRRAASSPSTTSSPGRRPGARSFQVLHGPHNGSTRGTAFVGYIPPGQGAVALPPLRRDRVGAARHGTAARRGGGRAARPRLGVPAAPARGAHRREPRPRPRSSSCSGSSRRPGRRRPPTSPPTSPRRTRSRLTRRSEPG